MKTADQVEGNFKEYKKEFTALHCLRLAEWYNEEGDFIGDFPVPASRERLWSCLSLFSSKDKKHHLRANKIILKTVTDHNHFLAPAAVELLTSAGELLSANSQKYLTEIITRHYPNLLEVRFSNDSSNNFSCMTTFFLMGAAELLDKYPWQAEFAAAEFVYNSARMQAVFVNAFSALQSDIEKREGFQEFNSPNYSAVSLHFLALMAEHSVYPEYRKAALEMEQKVWVEIFDCFSFVSDVSCGPYSRAYRMDLLGYVTNIKILLSAAGLLENKIYLEKLEDVRPSAFYPAHNLPFGWAQSAWLLSSRYHINQKVLGRFAENLNPRRVAKAASFPARGCRQSDGKLIKNIQGNAVPGNSTKIIQKHEKKYSLGYLTESRYYGHSFPLHLHYCLTGVKEKLFASRSVAMGIIFHGEPEEWLDSDAGENIETVNFSHAGIVTTEETGNEIHFHGQVYEGFCEGDDKSEKITFNCLIPVHYSRPEKLLINNRPFKNEPINFCGQNVQLEVIDSGFSYTITCSSREDVKVQFRQWGYFLRLSVEMKNKKNDITAGGVTGVLSIRQN
ncbi:MAG: hypothetical protein ACYTFY_09450 [Planctomycetota bacterium]|jgi:hypothetical protein